MTSCEHFYKLMYGLRRDDCEDRFYLFDRIARLKDMLQCSSMVLRGLFDIACRHVRDSFEKCSKFVRWSPKRCRSLVEGQSKESRSSVEEVSKRSRSRLEGLRDNIFWVVYLYKFMGSSSESACSIVICKKSFWI